MATKRVGITVTGDKEITEAFALLGDAATDAATSSIDAAGILLESEIKQNIGSMSTGKELTGFLLSSVGHTAKRDDNTAFGTAGIWHMDQVKAGFRSPPSGARGGVTNMGAPDIAWALEVGIQPHSLAGGAKAAIAPSPSKPQGSPAKGQDEGYWHTGVDVPRPFVSSAYDGNAAAINDLMDREIGDQIAKAWLK